MSRPEGGCEAPPDAGALLSRFRGALAGLGVEVVGGAAEAAAAVDARLVVRWATPDCRACRLDASEVVDWDPDRMEADHLREAAARADLGVAEAAWAVAATGTVALASGPGRSRLVTLLPPAVLFLVRPERIVATLADGLARLGEPPRMPAALNLVTGPSRSADIGGELTLGVHGPGRVFVHIVPGGRGGGEAAADGPAETG